MTTKPYVVLRLDDNDDYYDDGREFTTKFPDVDGSVLWHLTLEEAADIKNAFVDYYSPLHDKGYTLVRVIEPVEDSRQMVRDAIVKIRERLDKQRAEQARAVAQREAAAEKRRIAAAEKRLKKAAETKEQLYLRLKAEFEGEGNE